MANDLADLLQPGNTIRLIYPTDPANSRLMHIRAVVDTIQVVYRTWSRRNQAWVYRIEPVIVFGYWNDEGFLTLEKRKKV